MVTYDVRVFGRLLMLSSLLALSCVSTACTTRPDSTRVRGELDRSSWTLRDCADGTESRVVMHSALAAEYLATEHDLKVSSREPVVVEFQVTRIPPVSAGDRTLGVMRIISVQRGKCM